MEEIGTISGSRKTWAKATMIFSPYIFTHISKIHQGCVHLHSGEAVFRLSYLSTYFIPVRKTAKASIIHPTCKNRPRGHFHVEINVPLEGDFPLWTASQVCGASGMTASFLLVCSLIKTTASAGTHHMPRVQTWGAARWP